MMMEHDLDVLRAEYVRKRADAITYDAENCTSWREEIESLIWRADKLDGATTSELRLMIGELEENEANTELQ